MLVGEPITGADDRQRQLYVDIALAPWGPLLCSTHIDLRKF